MVALPCVGPQTLRSAAAGDVKQCDFDMVTDHGNDLRRRQAVQRQRPELA